MGPVMALSGSFEGRVVLGEVTVRPVRGVAEQRRWDALVAHHHYLAFHGLFGRALRHVAVQGERWLALLGWTAGAFKVGVRDAWVGWSPQQQFARLHLIANNSRFVMLTDRGRVPNLASRVLALSLRRVAHDMRARHGFPVVLAETFVDPSRFSGTCYRASNWRRLGLTRGFSRVPGGSARWRKNGQPKEVYVYALEAQAREALCATQEPAEWQLGAKDEPIPAEALRSLHAFLEILPDFRKRRGQRYSIACYMTIMLAARLAGYRGVTAFGEFAARLNDDQFEAVGAFWSPSRQRYTAPAPSTFHYILCALPPDALDRALREWVAQYSDKGTPVALDGKDVRGASKQLEGERRMMVAAVEHTIGLVPGQVQVGSKTNEIPAVRHLSQELDLEGRVVTLDALHAQQATARCLVEDCGADYVITAVKDNQPTVHEHLATIDWTRARWSKSDVDKGHGRLETRRCAALDITTPEWDGYCDLHGRKQAIRIERVREILKTGAISHETVFCLTSLGADDAGPDEVLSLVRNHWHIENRLHYVRDFTYDEDRCRARVRHLPRNLACLSNAAISIVRLNGAFRYLPEANRHYAARPQDALDAVLTVTKP